MLKVQKQSLVGDVLTFNVLLDDGSVHPCVYKLEDETEDTLMGRVALHVASEVAKKNTSAPLKDVAVEPTMRVSVSKAGKISVKEAIDESVA